MQGSSTLKRVALWFDIISDLLVYDNSEAVVKSEAVLQNKVIALI